MSRCSGPRTAAALSLLSSLTRRFGAAELFRSAWQSLGPKKRDGKRYPSAADETFLGRVAEWITARGEVLLLIQYSHAAGSKDFEFYDSVDAFRARLTQLPPRTRVIVFGGRQLPLRGRVDESFIRRAEELVPDGAEFLVVRLELVRYGTTSWFPKSAGESHEELQESLQDLYGEQVALGPYPPWLEDGEDVTSALIPNPDGSVTTGVY
jgi:hypothetical protein